MRCAFRKVGGYGFLRRFGKIVLSVLGAFRKQGNARKGAPLETEALAKEYAASLTLQALKLPNHFRIALRADGGSCYNRLALALGLAGRSCPMRVFACAVIGLFAVAMTASAQENLDTVLKGWEKSMTELRSFVSVVERSTFDKALNAHDEHKGYAMFMKAATKNDGSRARLEMAKVGKPEVFEKYICTGTFLYEYVPANKLIRIHNMPNNKQGGMQESFLSFLFGMGPRRRRSVMT